jgi:hypothetical protein
MPAVAIIAVVLSVASGVYSAVQQNKAGKAAEDAEEYNASIADQNARAIQDKAAYDEEMHRERVKKLLKSQRALYGGSGVDMEGSPLMVQADTTEQGEMDALAIRQGGNVQAAQQRSQANLMRMYGRNAASAGRAQATGTLLSTGASAVGSYYKMNTKTA